MKHSIVDPRSKGRRNLPVLNVGITLIGCVAATLVLASGCIQETNKQDSDLPSALDSSSMASQAEHQVWHRRDDVGSIPGSPEDPDERPRKHALLVGCTDYPNLGERYQLRGPSNDVALLRNLLIQSFGFDSRSDTIIELVASAAPESQPKRANIEAAFRALARQVSDGDQVVILLAGHGSQQPDNDPHNPDDPEPDGRDEIFLPSDVGGWNGQTGRVTNAIVDDELRGWLRRINDRGAFVWFIMDACHSGSGVRGSSAEISRHLPPGELVPEDVLTLVNTEFETSADTDNLPGTRYIALYASQPHETTLERKLPTYAPASERRFHGLLTFTLCEILSQATRRLTYKELASEIQDRYVAMGRRTPTPLIEGEQRHRLILGHALSPKRTLLTLKRNSDGSLAINSTALHGISTGSVLAVHSPATSQVDPNSGPVGHVRIVSQSLLTATVQACAYGATPANLDLPDGGRCELVFQDTAELPLAVSVAPLDNDGFKIPLNQRQGLIKDLKQRDSATIRVVEDIEDASWIVRPGETGLRLVPASGISTRDLAGHHERFSEIPRGDGWAEEAVDQLERVARAETLLRLGEIRSPTMSADGLGLQMSIDTGEALSPIEFGAGGVEMSDGTPIRIRLKNTRSQSLDLTLLYVDSSFGITCLFPNRGEYNRLNQDDERQLRLAINAETVGMEHLVAITVRGERQPVDFGFLEQAPISSTLPHGQKVRAGLRDRASSRGRSASSTPLGRLLLSATWGIGNTRGLHREFAADHEVQVVTWRVTPRSDP